MLRGYRDQLYAAGLILAGTVALGFCIAFVTWASLENAEYERQAHDRAEQYSKDTYNKEWNACIRLAEPDHSDCKREAEIAQSGYQHDQEDLLAQRTAALWAYVMGMSAAIGMGMSFIGAFLVWTTFRETQKANQISRDASRAWLSIVVSESGEFWLSAEKLEFHFDNILENHGDSPAIRAFCKGFLVLGDPHEFTLPALAEIAPVKSTDAECIVFPNSAPMGTGIIAELDGPIPEQSEINLVVVCRYRIVGHDDWRCSTRTFNLRPRVEMYTSSGRFQNGVCRLSVPENHAERIDLLLKERNDCPPTAT